MESIEGATQMAYEVDAREHPFELAVYKDRIVLRGDLDDSPDVLAACSKNLESVPKFSTFTIDADEIRLVPEGVTVWIEAVSRFLMGCELIYNPSQLSLILEYDDRYKHPKSTFIPYGDPTYGDPGGVQAAD